MQFPEKKFSIPHISGSGMPPSDRCYMSLKTYKWAEKALILSKN